MTASHIAFLRSINVGSRRVTNEELVAAFGSAGATDVSAYQAAGNIMCVPPAGGTEGLERSLVTALGYEVPVVLRSVKELEQVLREEPFPKAALLRATGKPQVIFVKEPLSASAQAGAEALAPPNDRLVARARHLHWLPADGVSGSELRIGDIEALGSLATVRTRGTIERIVARLSP